MASTEPERSQPQAFAPPFLPPRTLLGFAVAALAVLLIAALSYRALEERGRGLQRIDRTNQAISALVDTLSALKDMETGQRGFLLTASEKYLLPHTRGDGQVQADLDRLQALAGDDPAQAARLQLLRQLIAAKREELARTIELQRAGSHDAALELVRSDAGREVMQQIRAQVDEMMRHEQSTLAVDQQDWGDAASFSYYVSIGGLGTLMVLIVLSALLTSRDYRASELQTWLRNGQMGLGQRLQGDLRVDSLAEGAMDFLAPFLQAPLASVHVLQRGQLAHVASRGRAPADGDAAAGTGLLLDAARSPRPLHVRDVPEHYFDVASGLGRGRVRELLLVPARVDGRTYGVLELGFFRRVAAADIAFAELISEALAVAIRSAVDRVRLEELLEETQRQAEEMQTQQEELRVSNEELEEQSRLARQATAQLEVQQRELEQSNAVLEEQTSQLESQRDALADAQSGLTARAGELERANRYKSEFLANMSHELRTPLNSTLILSKLLADNKGGRLSDEEVNFARIITSAGNDLLALINDILDLSKIEAGKLDLVLEPVEPAALARELAVQFAPAIADKGLNFQVDIAGDVPASMHTDRQRLAQVLRNLLSNALKFTASGSIMLQVRPLGEDAIAFAVIDTGIGLPAEQHEVIFEAFRQADGSTHRRFGGTGLGLSISRDLAQRLGGDIRVQSAPGSGSTFVLELPLQAVEKGVPAALAAPASATPSAGAIAAATAAAAAVAASAVAAADGTTGRSESDTDTATDPGHDDRHRLAAGDRLILAVEDDPAFATILRDLVREAGFRCVLAHSGADGLAAAKRFGPHAILLDVVLPDMSGMAVLEQLKRDPHTRHIPVHMMSVADFGREARELGAIGYALKPVAREQLQDALRVLENKFSQQGRRVLVVEDDERQRISLTALLQTEDIRIVTAENAATALQLLTEMSFDCMVLDLNLPDLSGYQLLELMASRHDIGFPPVIVHTGRSLSREEEQKLLRYSDSIILKGARSPERLLDEVTLFLHQVEARLPAETQRLLREVRDRDEALDGRRLLVVEDDARNIHALTAVLQPRGAMLTIARNGHEALAALAAQDPQQPFDLVLMDIMMPEMDGLTATREIRKRPEWSRIPIIALTAKAMKDDREQCMAAGANDYIAKPLDVDRLLSLMRVWMPKQSRT